MNTKSFIGVCALLLAISSPNQAKAQEITPPTEPGSDQVILIKTSPAQSGGAHCILENKAGAKVVALTPEQTDITKAAGSLDIRCISTDGTWVGHMRLKPDVAGTFQTFVNLPFTGLEAINNIVNDFDEPMEEAVGSAVDYPKVIVVPMHSTIQRLTDAKTVSDSEAIANAPEQPIIEKTTPTPTPPIKHHHKQHIHHIYHTEESHS